MRKNKNKNNKLVRYQARDRKTEQWKRKQSLENRPDHECKLDIKQGLTLQVCGEMTDTAMVVQGQVVFHVGKKKK